MTAWAVRQGVSSVATAALFAVLHFLLGLGGLPAVGIAAAVGTFVTSEFFRRRTRTHAR